MKYRTLLLLAAATLLGMGASRLAAEDAPEFPKFDKQPVPMKAPPPRYPDGMSGANGMVSMIVIIDEKGNVTSATVSKTSHPLLEQPSVDAVKRWKFKPAEKEGQPVKARVVIPLVFKAD